METINLQPDWKVFGTRHLFTVASVNGIKKYALKAHKKANMTSAYKEVDEADMLVMLEQIKALAEDGIAVINAGKK